MKFQSTRDTSHCGVSAAYAIKTGMAPDGGLYMPEELPKITFADLEKWQKATYAERAADIIGLFLTDYSSAELLEDAKAAYSEERFPGGAAPVRFIDDDVAVLELWHGPTAAFKDMALQIMPRLLSRALGKTGETRKALILVATSGDTGKAALEGYRDVPGTAIQVFYPVDGVSKMQKMQMMTQEGENVAVTAIRGNFDDAQNGVKRIFADGEFADALNEKGIFLSSANSINWGRLVPQIVYYISAYCDMVGEGRIAMGEEIDVAVPTGNFGNIFAAYIAKEMGLPLHRLICASNENNVLTEFLETGAYNRNRPFHATVSPSMDILISSNLERLLYVMTGPEKTAFYMDSLAKTGRYALPEEEFRRISKTFSGYFASEQETFAAIRSVYLEKGYLMDTHTAVGYTAVMKHKNARGSKRKVLLASTANPYKFAADVLRAVNIAAPEDPLLALNELSKTTGTPIHPALSGILSKTVRFSDVTDADLMRKTVLAFAEKQN